MERYELLGPVGEGSYGTVLKCRHRDSGRLVAIKKFMDSEDDKTVKKIAHREIKLLRQLRHDNLVNLLEVWKRRRRWYLVFEFVDRTLLDDLEQKPNGLDLNTSRQYLYQILRAATFCHQQNIIHRDIKPENILISQGGVIKLCDFGFARTVASASEGGVYTDYVATRWYRAPELLVGDIKYGKPVDVWAIGCLLLEMLTGQPLFPGDSDLDQIYHIIRCFGNLTSHHQELFYRNPVFSGARLPECSGRVPLQQRFPAITPTALDLAQSCLEMDPERRAQCSDLLEHLLFTQDSFHIRFSDELHAKIQNDHRENSTLPKITKTSRPERDDVDEKNRKGKDKKQPDDVDERVNKDKTKGKQPQKLSKTTRNTSESLMSTKQPKTVGHKVNHNAAQSTVKGKAGKVTGAEVKSDPSETTKTVGNLKDRVATKPPEPNEDYSAGSDKTEQNVTEKYKPKPSLEFGRSSKVPKGSTADRPNVSLSAVELTHTSQTRSPSEDQPGLSTKERTSECPKVSPSNPKPSTSNSAPKMNKTTSPSKNLTSGLSAQSSRGLIEASPTHSTVGIAKGTSNPKLSKGSKGHPKERQITEDKDMKEDCGSLKPEAPGNLVQVYCASGRDNEENPSCQHEQSTFKSKISTETSMSNQNTSAGTVKALTVSDKENREDSLNVPHNKPSAGEPKMKPGSFSNHKRSTETRKRSDKPERKDTNTNTNFSSATSTATPDHQTLTAGSVTHSMDAAGLHESVIRGPQSSPPPPPPPPSSTPLLLPPSSTSLTPSFCVVNTSSPPVSDHFTMGTGFHPGTHSIRCVDKPKYHGGISGRQTQHVHLSGPPPFQASEKSLISERSFLSDRCNLGNGGGSSALTKNKPHVHFPDLRSSMLPELRGREGKHNKGTTKDQRTKHPAPSSPPSEQHGHSRTDTNTPKHT